MKILTDKNSGAIIAISEKAIVLDNGIDVGGCVYVMKDIIDIFDVEEVPLDIKPQQYCYSPEGGFYANSDYTASHMPLEMEIEDLKRQIAEIKAAMEVSHS